eukprot:9348447-Alexandrium_andersonii.AAC.1
MAEAQSLADRSSVADMWRAMLRKQQRSRTGASYRCPTWKVDVEAIGEATPYPVGLAYSRAVK